MSKEKFLTIAVVFLVLLNLGVLTFLFITRPSHPPEPWRMVVKEVGFNDQQTQQYFALRDAHRNEMHRLDDQFGETLRDYFDLLKGIPNPSLEDSLLTRLGRIEREKAMITFGHFREVKSLCRPDQVDAFNRILPELTRVVLPPKKDLSPRRN